MASDIEEIEDKEEERINRLAEITTQLLDRRYTDEPPVRRGVHPKDHGCVEAMWEVRADLPPEYRVGIFKNPGERLRAAIRFSNATALVTPDSFDRQPDGKTVKAHGSRGMAIKLYRVGGERLDPNDGETTQDFLMINQPVFAFANVEDYHALNEVMIAHPEEKPDGFFLRAGRPPLDPIGERARRSFGIISQIKSMVAPPPGAPTAFEYQAPPLSPLDNRYFSAAPFLFGEGRAMKFSARPVNPMSGDLGPAIDDADYLRKAMAKRMAEADGKDICFDFQIQVRTNEQLASDVANQIENMCTEWKDEYVTVARITIPPQDVTSEERRNFCESLFYTPWHGLAEHRPLGGINRMRRKVYLASATRRKPPVSPDLPPLPKGGADKGPPRGDGKPPPGRARQS